MRQTLFFLLLATTLAAQTAPPPDGSGPVGPAGQPETIAGGTPVAKKISGVLLKNIATISGVRTNQLLGYGLVVGLPGSGDTRSGLARESIKNLLGSLEQNMTHFNLDARNIAAVLVTAEIPAFARKGDRFAVTVSSIGDARSLSGGVLIQTPLYGANRTIYAAAQGVVTTAEANQPDDRAGAPGKTVGAVMGGALMERDVSANLTENSVIRISLKKFDFTTLEELRKRLRESLGQDKLELKNGALELAVPEGQDPVSFIAKIENLRIEPSSASRVVINERSGTIVMGGDLYVSPVSVTRGGLQIIVTGNAGQGHPDAAVRGETHLVSGSSVNDILQILNSIGASVKDVIAILEALKEAGALHAEIVVM
ncbi:MAG: flagellar basal body P-ring protein FlgI [Spirochaetales bacterium]|nr:flagellar basal body P-ring protein FlgI [Spirochaetales bacterium]